MGAIIPSILESSKAEIEAKLALLKGHAQVVQIDVVDGVFAGPPTWPYSEGGTDVIAPPFDIHELGDFRYEMDLMVKDPRSAMSAFLHAGAGKLIIHLESTPDLPGLIDELEQTYGRDKEFSAELLSLGLSIQIGTDLALLEPHLPRIDYVQFMGIAHVGKQGVPFDERVIEKIRAFKHAHLEIPVQVDGGVSLETAPKLLAAGVERLVVGSALWHSKDVVETLHAFDEVVETYGRYH